MSYTKPLISEKLLSNSRKLRKEMTTPERKLWHYLRNNTLGLKFRRQVPIDLYIVDFYCFEKKLIVEIDGDSHGEIKQIQYDQKRTHHFEEFGYSVMRFTNADVVENIEGVIMTIQRFLNTPSP